MTAALVLLSEQQFYDRSDAPALPKGATERSTVFAPRKQRIVLDQGLLCFVGHGQVADRAQIGSAIWLAFRHGETGATLTVGAAPSDAEIAATELLIVASRQACERAFGTTPSTGRWYLSSDLRTITTAIAGRGPAGCGGNVLYLRAKGLELACEAFAALHASSLIPCCGADGLSEGETRRLVAARDLIEARLQETLSLDLIARTCGLNRSNLTRGFRQLHGASVATFIANARMVRARTLLMTTDLAVAMVGFRCGYRNNASFARSFVRHFGIPPSAVRSSTTSGTAARGRLGARQHPAFQA